MSFVQVQKNARTTTYSSKTGQLQKTTKRAHSKVKKGTLTT